MNQPITNHSKLKKENMFLNLGFNLILPMFFLMKGEKYFGDYLENIIDESKNDSFIATIMLLIAISFPIGYGTLDFIKRKKLNFFSVLGLISVLLTGGIGLIPGATVAMFAIKEAAIPALLGLATMITLKTNNPLVKLFFYNPNLIQVDLVDRALEKNGTKEKFNQLLRKCTWLIALTFIFSACLNYFLALYIVKTEPSVDRTAFNNEVGTMMGLSFPIISLPCMAVSGYALWILIKGIRDNAGYSFEEIIKKQ